QVVPGWNLKSRAMPPVRSSGKLPRSVPKGYWAEPTGIPYFPCISSFSAECFKALRPRAKARAERMPTFLKSIFVEAPVETVFGFHEREDALRLLSPRFP